ncbi:MAG: aminoacyl-tRNA hydrolase [Candidatus Velthaea sp.]
MALDALAERFGVATQWKSKDGTLQILDRTNGVVLVKPQTFMNLSGEPAQRVAAWHKVEPQQMLVVVDELDIPFGKLRMRERGSAGGHNGLKSMIQHFGEDFPRLRIGIGRDSNGGAIDRVLGTFSPDEEPLLPAIIDASAEGSRLWLTEKLVTAINFVNGWTSGQ